MLETSKDMSCEHHLHANLKRKIEFKNYRKKWFIIYPEHYYKNQWDLFVGLILIITCSITPIHIAFFDINDESRLWDLTSLVFDLLFGIDLIL